MLKTNLKVSITTARRTTTGNLETLCALKTQLKSLEMLIAAAVGLMVLGKCRMLSLISRVMN